jgi:hypothetical protein
MAFPYPNSFFLLGFRADRILLGFECEYGFFMISEMVRIRTCVGAEADFF